MFIGHLGLAFGAKSAAPSVSLGTLFLAAPIAELLSEIALFGVGVSLCASSTRPIVVLGVVHLANTVGPLRGRLRRRRLEQRRRVGRVHRVPRFGSDPNAWFEAADAIARERSIDVVLPTHEQDASTLA